MPRDRLDDDGGIDGRTRLHGPASGASATVAFQPLTPCDAAIHATMGAFAVLFIGGVFPFAWEIARRPGGPVDRTTVQTAVAGLLHRVLSAKPATKD